MTNLRHGDKGHFAETEKKEIYRLNLSCRAMCLSLEGEFSILKNEWQ